MPLPQEILLSLQIGHAPQQTIFEGSMCKKRNGRQSVIKEVQDKITMKYHYTVPWDCFKYRSQWQIYQIQEQLKRTLLVQSHWKLICPLCVLFSHCCNRIPDRNSLWEAWLIWALGSRVFPFMGWGRGLVAWWWKNTVGPETRKQKVQAEPWGVSLLIAWQLASQMQQTQLEEENVDLG